MEKFKNKDSIWRDKDKPRTINQCSSGVTFWADKKDKQGEQRK